MIPYPWQQQYWQSFLSQFEQHRIPHGILLAGQKGIGKWAYAHAMADFLLCLTPKSGLACGTCKACLLNEAGTHPDKCVVEPEEYGKQIKIDQIRNLSSFVGKTAQQSGRKVIVLGPAESLNINAANALLKNLEEPTEETFFLMTSQTLAAVMATVRSRCHILSMVSPSRESVLQWFDELGFGKSAHFFLDIASGAPLVAKSLLEGDKLEQLTSFYEGVIVNSEGGRSDLSVANHWKELELLDLVDWWLQSIHHLVKYRIQAHEAFNREDMLAVGESPGLSQFIDNLAKFRGLSAHINWQWLFRFMDKLLLIKQQLQNGANPNKQLLLEELLMDWSSIARATS